MQIGTQIIKVISMTETEMLTLKEALKELHDPHLNDAELQVVSDLSAALQRDYYTDTDKCK